MNSNKTLRSEKLQQQTLNTLHFLIHLFSIHFDVIYLIFTELQLFRKASSTQEVVD